MTRKIYRTAQGKMVDLGSMQLRNEDVRAVGNMKVNARGDLIDSQNRPIDPRSHQVSRQYKKQTSNVKNQGTRPSSETVLPQKSIASEKQDLPEISQSIDETTSGLAAAIARARQIKQEPLPTPDKTLKKI